MLESIKILYNNGMLRKILEYYIGCIGTKTVVIHMIHHDSPIFIYYFGVAYIFIAVRFMYLFFFDTTEMSLTVKSNFAIESKLWLNKFRLIHSAIYFTFSLFVLRGYTEGCWKILVVDIIFGTTTYTVCLIKDLDFCKNIKSHFYSCCFSLPIENS